MSCGCDAGRRRLHGWRRRRGCAGRGRHRLARRPLLRRRRRLCAALPLRGLRGGRRRRRRLRGGWRRRGRRLRGRWRRGRRRPRWGWRRRGRRRLRSAGGRLRVADEDLGSGREAAVLGRQDDVQPGDEAAEPVLVVVSPHDPLLEQDGVPPVAQLDARVRCRGHGRAEHRDAAERRRGERAVRAAPPGSCARLGDDGADGYLATEERHRLHRGAGRGCRRGGRSGSLAGGLERPGRNRALSVCERRERGRRGGRRGDGCGAPSLLARHDDADADRPRRGSRLRCRRRRASHDEGAQRDDNPGDETCSHQEQISGLPAEAALGPSARRWAVAARTRRAGRPRRAGARRRGRAEAPPAGRSPPRRRRSRR